MVRSPSIAVIDIGSNSIKILVAARAADGSITTLHQRTIDARISAGIGKTNPLLTEDGMKRGLEALRELLDEAAPFSPAQTLFVATSAVRDARNGADFRARVQAATGLEIRILTGDEEASFVGLGLTCDPALRDRRDFYVFDLGGGSLECLAFRDRRIQQAVSLQLGCVRLMEKFVPDPTAPLPDGVIAAIEEHIRDRLRDSGFTFSLPSSASAIGTGGTMTTARAMLGAREKKTLEATAPLITSGQLHELFTSLAPLELARRKQVPGLPPARADVMPVALLTFLTLADAGGFSSFGHSLYNLRYGLAAEAL